jgi:hypothetical protein
LASEHGAVHSTKPPDQTMLCGRNQRLCHNSIHNAADVIFADHNTILACVIRASKLAFGVREQIAKSVLLPDPTFLKQLDKEIPI